MMISLFFFLAPVFMHETKDQILKDFIEWQTPSKSSSEVALALPELTPIYPGMTPLSQNLKPSTRRFLGNNLLRQKLSRQEAITRWRQAESAILEASPSGVDNITMIKTLEKLGAEAFHLLRFEMGLNATFFEGAFTDRDSLMFFFMSDQKRRENVPKIYDLLLEGNTPEINKLNKTIARHLGTATVYKKLNKEQRWALTVFIKTLAENLDHDISFRDLEKKLKERDFQKKFRDKNGFDVYPLSAQISGVLKQLRGR